MLDKSYLALKVSCVVVKTVPSCRAPPTTTPATTTSTLALAFWFLSASLRPVAAGQWLESRVT